MGFSTIQNLKWKVKITLSNDKMPDLNLTFY